MLAAQAANINVAIAADFTGPDIKLVMGCGRKWMVL